MGKVLFRLAIIGCCIAVALMLFRSYLPSVSEHSIAAVGDHNDPIHLRVWMLAGVAVFFLVGAKVK